MILHLIFDLVAVSLIVLINWFLWPYFFEMEIIAIKFVQIADHNRCLTTLKFLNVEDLSDHNCEPYVFLSVCFGSLISPIQNNFINDNKFYYILVSVNDKHVIDENDKLVKVSRFSLVNWWSKRIDTAVSNFVASGGSFCDNFPYR